MSSPNWYRQNYMKNSLENSEVDQRVKAHSKIGVATILCACEEWFD